MGESTVRVQHLVKRYGDLVAVNDISFEVQPGEIFAFLGPNGAGKTTTVEILECLRSLTSGEVTVLGENVNGAPGTARIKKRIGVLPQDFNALRRLTVRENLELFAAMYDNPASVNELIEVFGLQEKAKVRFDALSGGLKQRVGVAAALVNNPDLVFLDEPTTGLDPEVRRATWGVIRGLRGRGKTVFLTTHYMEEAQELADRIAMIVKGKIAAIGTPGELIKTYGGERTIVFTKGGDAVFGTLRRYFDNVAAKNGDVLLPYTQTRDVEVALNALTERGLKVEIALRSPTIEDVFLKLAGFSITAEGEAK
ncbi:MAG TPA: ABC transporter ATP-binding protein [Nitrososphaerales archaeon]|nr:ABC transporter ATP-binding protein [Nitrososphaerales archaeon]